jgi:hypothetical protein
MKKMLLFFVLIMQIFLCSINAQKVNQCGYIIPPKSSLKNNFQSVYEARDIVKVMLDSIKWKENFTLQEKNGSNNAFATIINNKRWIIYDNDFLESIDNYAATKWASISVLAHEVGHHKFNHVFSGQGSTVPTEIVADEFSGYMMYKLGATLDNSVAAIKTISTDKASATHPAKLDRVNAITKGWNKAKAENKNSGNGGEIKPPVETPEKPPVTPAEDQNYISLTMQNIKDESILLSDDGKSYQAMVMKVGVPFDFKFEIYNYGYLKLPYYNSYKIYKLIHGKDYAILWNNRKKIWTLVEVPLQ